MNFASEELSKELHKLSNWEGDDFMVENGTLVSVSYSLGYLLRKLKNLPIALDSNFGEGWRASEFHDNEVSFEFTADTPEDAAAKLCVELFKQGVLNKKEDK